MPQANDVPSLPFVTRKMLNFDFASKIELKISHLAVTAHTYYVTGLTRNGTFTYAIKTAATGLAVETWLPLDDIPIWISVMDIGDVYSKGHLYVQVWLEVNSVPSLSLCSGYVGHESSISYPLTFQQEMTPAHNVMYTYTGANPVAGAEAIITVPAGEVWKVKAVNVVLVTDATAVSRFTNLSFGDVTNVISASNTAWEQTASQTRQICGITSSYFPAQLQGTNIIIPIPHDLWLQEGETIKTVTTGLQAGDNYAAPIVFYNQYLKL